MIDFTLEINQQDLTYINCSRKQQQLQQSPLLMCLWNCQSIRNKTAAFHDYLCDKRVDLCALTETWLSASDAAVKAECLPAGYKMYDYPRTSRGLGGIALVAREGLFVSLGKTDTMRSFEFVELEVSCDSFKIRLVIDYLSHPVFFNTPCHGVYFRIIWSPLYCQLNLS